MVEIAVGSGIIGLWTVLLITGRVPEIPAGDRAICFHIAAEYLLGAALAMAGLLLLLVGDDGWVRVLAATAAGGMIYSTINSPGHYARQGQWGPVAAFAALALLGVALMLILAWPR